MTSSPPTAKIAVKDQYQHYIPKFILRRFQVGPVKSKAERSKAFRLTGLDPELILYYDLAAGTLDTRSIGEVYGVYGLYKDAANVNDVNELEKKLSDLESAAVNVIHRLHAQPGRSDFTMRRTELECLTKFLFLMHYRHSALPSSYFQADHPEDMASRAWIEQLQSKHELHSATDASLHVLRYYLYTSHAQIMQHAAGLIDKYGKDGYKEMMAGIQVPPDAEHFPSLAYQGQAGAYFLCIWEAADGEEFVLSQNGFGLGEGLAAEVPGLHRIFVISPRIVVVLRSTMMRPETLGFMRSQIVSDLADIEQGPPTPTYGNEKDAVHVATGCHGGSQSSENYRSSKQAEKDLFKFQINKLTPSQTHCINAVLLKSTRPSGSITFVSKDCMLRTARTFCNTQLNLLESSRYQSLIQVLSASITPPSLNPIHAEDVLLLGAQQSPNLPTEGGANTSTTHVDAENTADLKLMQVLGRITDGTMRYTSDYDRAYQLLEVCDLDAPPTNPFSTEIQRVVSSLFQRFVSLMKPPPSPFIPGSTITLVDHLSERDSKWLFTIMSQLTEETMGLAPLSRSANLLEKLMYQTGILGILLRIGQQRPDAVQILQTMKIKNIYVKVRASQ